MVCLVHDAAGELRHVLGSRDAVANELRGARDGGERRLELVRYVRGELATHEVRTAELPHLLVNTIDQGLELHVGALRVRVRGVDVEDGLHKPVDDQARHGPAYEDHRSDYGNREKHIVPKSRLDAIAGDGKAQYVAVIEANGAIDFDPARRGRVTFRRALSRLERTSDLGAVGMVGHAVDAVLVVIEHGAVGADDGHARLAEVEVGEVDDVRLRAAHARLDEGALGLEHAAGVAHAALLVDE